MTYRIPYQLNIDLKIERSDSFETFLVNSENEIAIDICKDFIDNDIKGSSLTIHAPEGAGKTHLLIALGNRYRLLTGRNPVYIRSEDILKRRELNLSILDESGDYSLLYDLFIVDDVDLLFENHQAQEDLFNIYNISRSSGCRFISSIKGPPSSWKLEDFLKSRLLWGKTVAIYPVSGEILIDALCKVGSDLGLTLDRKVANWMVNHLPRDLPTLREIIRLTNDYGMSNRRKVGISLIKEVIGFSG